MNGYATPIRGGGSIFFAGTLEREVGPNSHPVPKAILEAYFQEFGGEDDEPTWALGKNYQCALGDELVGQSIAYRSVDTDETVDIPSGPSKIRIVLKLMTENNMITKKLEAIFDVY